MTDLITKLEELLARATPGPWRASPYQGHLGSQVWAGNPGPDAVLICGDGDADDANAALIVEAVNSLPELIQELRSLHARNDAVIAALGVDEHSVEFNLEGAVEDLKGQFDPKDGGVCVRTIERAIEQIHKARNLILPTPHVIEEE